jgi:hypothetical protein
MICFAICIHRPMTVSISSRNNNLWKSLIRYAERKRHLGDVGTERWVILRGSLKGVCEFDLDTFD